MYSFSGVWIIRVQYVHCLICTNYSESVTVCPRYEHYQYKSRDKHMTERLIYVVLKRKQGVHHFVLPLLVTDHTHC